MAITLSTAGWDPWQILNILLKEEVRRTGLSRKVLRNSEPFSSAKFFGRDWVTGNAMYGIRNQSRIPPFYGMAAAAQNMFKDSKGNQLPHETNHPDYPEGWRLLHAFFWMLESLTSAHYPKTWRNMGKYNPRWVGGQLEDGSFGYPTAGLKFWEEWEKSLQELIHQASLATLKVEAQRSLGPQRGREFDELCHIMDNSGFEQYLF